MNLRNISIDRLEMLPTHTKIRRRINNSLQEADLGWKGYRDPIKVNTACRIVKGSVGRNIKNIYHRIKPLVEGRQNYGSTMQWLYQRYIANNRYLRYKWTSSYYLENNILCKTPSEPRRGKYPNRENYLQNRMSEKKRKKERQFISMNLVDMINKPELLQFYTKLISRRESIRSILNKLLPSKPEIEWSIKVYINRRNFGPYKMVKDENAYFKYIKKLKVWRFDIIRYHKEQEEAKKDMKSVQYQIEQLENKNYKAYFESNVYLYSLQKECHHYQTP